MTCLLAHFAHLRPQISVVPTGPGIGYLNLNGSLGAHTNRVVWTESGQSLAVPTQTQLANATVWMGSIAGTEIIATGNLVTTGPLWIAGPNTNINTQTATQKGGGTVTLVDPQTVGINGVNNINVQAGATLRLGNDWTKVHGWFYSPAGNAQMANNGTLEIRSANHKNIDLQVGGNSSATGITRYIGKPDGTSFYDSSASPNTYGQTFRNLGLLEIDNTVFRPRTIQTAGPGTIRVKDGGTLITTMNSASQKVFLSGNGGNAADYPKAAFALEYGKNFYSTSTIELEADATIVYQGTEAQYDSGFGWFPPIISTVDKTLSIGCPTVGGTASPGYGNTSYTAFQVANPNLLGPIKVEFGTLGIHVANAAANAANIHLDPGTKLKSNITNSVKSITSTDDTATVQLAAGNLTLTAQSPTPLKANISGAGILSVAGGTLLIDRATTSATGNINVTTGKFGTTQAVMTMSGIFSPGATGTGTLVVSNVGGTASKIVAPTINAPTAGWKVDVPAGLAAGTYTILTRTNGTVVPPVVGVNASGLTATFAWVGSNLNMTLA